MSLVDAQELGSPIVSGFASSTKDTGTTTTGVDAVLPNGRLAVPPAASAFSRCDSPRPGVTSQARPVSFHSTSHNTSNVLYANTVPVPKIMNGSVQTGVRLVEIDCASLEAPKQSPKTFFGIVLLRIQTLY